MEYTVFLACFVLTGVMLANIGVIVYNELHLMGDYYVFIVGRRHAEPLFDVQGHNVLLDNRRRVWFLMAIRQRP